MGQMALGPGGGAYGCVASRLLHRVATATDCRAARLGSVRALALLVLGVMVAGVLCVRGLWVWELGWVPRGAGIWCGVIGWSSPGKPGVVAARCRSCCGSRGHWGVPGKGGWWQTTCPRALWIRVCVSLVGRAHSWETGAVGYLGPPPDKGLGGQTCLPYSAPRHARCTGASAQPLRRIRVIGLAPLRCVAYRPAVALVSGVRAALLMHTRGCQAG